MINSFLASYGYSNYTIFFPDISVPENFTAARVVTVHKNGYTLATEQGILFGEATGRLLYASSFDEGLPQVGDWVLVTLYGANSPAMVHQMLPRFSVLSRLMPGTKAKEQVLAANITKLFVVESCDKELSINRVERFLSATSDKHIQRIVVLSKADLCSNIAERIGAIKSRLASTIDVVAVSSTERTGVSKVEAYIGSGETAVFIGLSGVGKSSLINALLDEERLKVGDVRTADHRGRHTSTAREMFVLKRGGVVIDSPGIREFRLTEQVEGSDLFPDVEELALQCKFSGCTHTVEPQCAVQNALANGTLDSMHFENYQKMLREKEYYLSLVDRNLSQARKEKTKKLFKDYANFVKEKKRLGEE
ncbi:MAG: ribosome small subunit-dependent GTPase A [Bacteroidales bacterium]|nr:ribosome small subunit-dependent GTPase A [Bacteroidales bacterium]